MSNGPVTAKKNSLFINILTDFKFLRYLHKTDVKSNFLALEFGNVTMRNRVKTILWLIAVPILPMLHAPSFN